MLRVFSKNKAQSTAEYAIIIALVVGAVVAMQTYVKRGIQARVHDESAGMVSSITNETNWTGVSSAGTVTLKSQYEPETLSSKSTQEIVGTATEDSELQTGGKIVNRVSNQTTKQAVGDYQKQSY